jgi:hypothetical protein
MRTLGKLLETVAAVLIGLLRGLVELVRSPFTRR